MASEIEVRSKLVEKFPGLGEFPFDLTSDPTPFYNCIAWAAGVDNQFWWPGSRFWPIKGKQVTRKSFVRAFETKGYLTCDGASLEEGFEKIALYEFNGAPKHAARQLPDGRWTSKLGQFHDIAHSLEALNGIEYGEPVIFMKRPRPLN